MKKAAATRLHILQKAFELIYAKGYQATSIDDILATTQVTKGAFYYHFKNKDEMGLAIIGEIMQPALSAAFIEPLQQAGDPLKIIYGLVHGLLLENAFMKMEYGCPASNLTQEMTPWHPGFNKILQELTGQWSELMAQMIEKGKPNGFVREQVNAKQVALFVMSGYWGVRNLGKLEPTPAVYRAYLKELEYYLDSLR